jgi:hypothetical protein
MFTMDNGDSLPDSNKVEGNPLILKMLSFKTAKALLPGFHES